jgi:Family of unknown function (DUF5372)
MVQFNYAIGPPKTNSFIKHFYAVMFYSKQPTAGRSSAPADANRYLPAASIIAHALTAPCRFPPAAIGSVHVPAACTCIRNAGDAIAAASLVRVTHPFHPLSGRQFACVGERYNRYGKRLLLRVDDAIVRSIPPQWTDVVAPDPEIAMGGHRALFRAADLLELTELVEELSRRKSSSGSSVKQIVSRV